MVLQNRNNCSKNLNETETFLSNRRNIREATRYQSEEPSLSLAPRLGSVDRAIDEENPRRYQRSWRSQMREQQLADNCRLLESVKRKMSSSPAPPDRTNISNSNNQ